MKNIKKAKEMAIQPSLCCVLAMSLVYVDILPHEAAPSLIRPTDLPL